MSSMIKLRLPKSLCNFESVQKLPGLADLNLDEEYGLVMISPRESLYVIRTDSVDDIARRRELSPEIIGVYGDSRISST